MTAIRIISPKSIMDLLKSLIVPLPFLNPSSSDAPRESLQHAYCATAPSGRSSCEGLPLVPPTGPSAQHTARQGSASTPTEKKKKKQQKRKQTNLEESRTAAAPVLTSPAAVTKAKKRKHNHFFHPDRPKASASKRTVVSYEDLYDDVQVQQPDTPPPDPQNSKSNPESTQTCFFWYHGSCRRSLDKRGCQLRHALLDPQSPVVAPPRFVHPKPCELQWCAGDGESRKGKKVEVGAEQKRYFEVAISDDGSAHEDAGQAEKDDIDCFLAGFDEPDD